MAERMEQEQQTDEAFSASRWFGVVGGGLATIGVVAAVVMWSQMAEDDYTTLDRWLAVLAGLTLTGIGMTVAALGAVLAKLGD